MFSNITQKLFSFTFFFSFLLEFNLILHFKHKIYFLLEVIRIILLIYVFFTLNMQTASYIVYCYFIIIY